jgi:cytochrome c-type biogenesis protein
VGRKPAQDDSKQRHLGSVADGTAVWILGPCTFAYMAPMLGVVFRVASTNPVYTIVLLKAFGAGHCSVIVLAGTMTEQLQSYLNWTEQTKATKILRKVCGVLVLLGGVYLIYI